MTENGVIIKEIKIIKFGKLKDVTINPGEGLNVIYGKNESGKSTIQLFLKAMLYGLASRKKSGDLLKERDRAVPWLEKRAEGVLTLMVNGREIEIHRSF
ncbi:MAG: AAA family ATPase, partial [Clostridia bacterium]|nr:AAA family ATPase [Clostridia bacterium]